MRTAAVALLTLGLAQMTGDALGLDGLRGLAAATTASPAPKVFSAMDGFETYSTRFHLEWQDEAGEAHALELTPEVYARLRGPYNRRNAYGAIVSYGPVLASNPATSGMFARVAAFALCGRSPLLTELGIAAMARGSSARVRLEPSSGSRIAGRPLVFEAECP